MAIREFPTLVKKVKIVEHLECSNWVVKTRGDGSSGSKKGNHQKKPYSRPQQHHGGSTVPQVGKQARVEKPKAIGVVVVVSGAKAFESDDLV
ncbi:hypothetical protein JHK85_010472 [Glycine max]|nr:hypothetical protein JHK85_010472 [Glycine max]KAG5066464.1 hypothetical protein JHK86_010195 [Glycine max]